MEEKTAIVHILKLFKPNPQFGLTINDDFTNHASTTMGHTEAEVMAIHQQGHRREGDEALAFTFETFGGGDRDAPKAASRVLLN
jgi:hypothetical protein